VEMVGALVADDAAEEECDRPQRTCHATRSRFARARQPSSRSHRSGSLRQDRPFDPCALLHKALKDAVRKRLIQWNVATEADPPKICHHGAGLLTWTAAELRTFIEGTAQHQLGVAFLLAATTGMRRGEVLGVRWRDIDLDARRLAVRQTVLSMNYRIVLGEPKTSRSRRLIALDPNTVEALRREREVQDHEPE
jgi:integrase